ncbi:hypothetical protein [Nostoc sp.]|uniref:hypothetical protein n=1 Tax=Nostoc sp. TaxID=1180 RepID=UPI002FF9E2FE
MTYSSWECDLVASLQPVVAHWALGIGHWALGRQCGLGVSPSGATVVIGHWLFTLDKSQKTIARNQ